VVIKSDFFTGDLKMKKHLLILSLVMMVFIIMGCDEVVYTVETKGPCIKFEDAMSYDEALEEMVEDCLGEDGVVEGDFFYALLDEDVVIPDPLEDGDTVAIAVNVKAGKCKETITELVYSEDYGAFIGEACSFMILGGPESADEWVFFVISDDIDGSNKRDGTSALSNITFCFDDAEEVVEPEEGEFETGRANEEEIEEELN
jgi:hypothetical protein